MNSINQKKKMDIPIIFFLLAFLSFGIFLAVGTILRPTDLPDKEREVYSYEETFVSSSTKEAVSLPYKLNLPAGEEVTLSTVLPLQLKDNYVMNLRADQHDMEVYIDGELRITYSTADTRYFGLVSPRRYIYLPLFREDSGKVMEVRLLSTADEMGTFDVLPYGDKSDILFEMIGNNAADVLVAFVMLLVSIICFVMGIVLHYALKTEVPLTYLAILGVLASIWILCNAEISQLYFPNVSFSMIVNFYSLLLLPYPLLIYVNAAQKRRRNKLFKTLECLLALNITVCVALTAGNVIDVSQVFLAMAGGFSISVIAVLVTNTIDIIKKRAGDYIIVAAGVYVAIFVALFQLTMFGIGFYDFGGNAVGVALLIMLFFAIVDTFKKVQKMQQEKQTAQAEQAAETRFLANMSHEIRTPINAVLGMNEMILRESTEPEVRGYANNIARSGAMLLSIVNDILDFSKIRAGKLDLIPDNYSLYEQIEDVCVFVREKAEEKGLEFIMEVQDDLPNDLYGDAFRMKQVVVNLLNNAVKYTDKGYVRFELTGEKTGDIEETFTIKVKDSGRGIKEEDQGELFEAFSRADEKKNRSIEGTGLGLALVKQLVALAGGTVQVESTYGVGSCFTVCVTHKVTSDRTIAQARGEKPVENKGGEALFVDPNARVLAVDDTRMNLLVLKGFLKRTKVQLDTVTSGRECLEKLKNSSYDLILLDHLMPGMDGEETLKEIREQHLAEGVPVIALTANAISGAREHYMEVGFDDYLTKPVIAKDLEEMLQKWIQH